MNNAFLRLPIVISNAKYKVDVNKIVDISDAFKPVDSEYYFDFSSGERFTRSGKEIKVMNGNYPMTFRNGGLVMVSGPTKGYGFIGVPETMFPNGYVLCSSVKIPKGAPAFTGVNILLNFFNAGTDLLNNQSNYCWHFSGSGLLLYGGSKDSSGVTTTRTILSKGFKASAGAVKLFTEDVKVTTILCVDPVNKRVEGAVFTNQSDSVQTGTYNTDASNTMRSLNLNIGSCYYPSGANTDGAADYIMKESFLLPNPLPSSDLVKLVKERYVRNFG